MRKRNFLIIVSLLLIAQLLLTACQPSPAATSSNGQNKIKVLAVETFLADMAQNVSGGRLAVTSLVPIGMDPHAFEPTPQDVAAIASSQILIINGAGVESWLNPVLKNVGNNTLVLTASDGLPFRTAKPGEVPIADNPGGGDPHFWLDPLSAIQYVQNIQKAFSNIDPAGAADYQKNADAYIAQLKDLDGWIKAQVNPIPAAQRLLITNHESLGYFADRYGFTIVGSIIPSFSTDASPSAQDLAALTTKIRESGAKAIFLETGSNPQLAEQLAKETGVKVVTDLYTHSTTASDGPAPTYLQMMRHNTMAFVNALKAK
jgi:ABC-type Zn uptake system ZnuABC Zn-binding protein ZnuA